MLNVLRDIGGFILLPVVATIIGGVVATVRRPGPRLQSGVQHFAAGVVFAAVAGELLPQLVHERSPLPVIIGIASGVAAMLVVRELTEPRAEQAKAGAASRTGLIIIVSVDIAVDGLLVGIGFAAGRETGLLITIALTIEVLFLSLATATELMQGGVSRGRILGVIGGLAAVLAVAAGVGMLLLSGLSGAPFVGVLAFGAAALLYLVTEELLVGAHESLDTPLLTAMFFVGFLTLLVIEILA